MGEDALSGKQYLEALYGNCDRGHLVFVAPSRDMVSAVFDVKRLDLAARHIKREPRELFLKINVMDHERTRQRSLSGIGGTDEVMAVVSFHLDVDAGKNDKYLTPQKMLDALGVMPLAPSAIIKTNGDDGGFHAYWFLEQPHYITDEVDRQRIQDISNRWLEELRIHASPGTIDGTANLDRILRPVGSLRKSGNRVEPLTWKPERRYQIEQFVLPELEGTSIPQWETDSPRTEDESVIERYLNAMGLNSPEAILSREGYTRVRDNFWIRPGSQSGVPTGEVYRCKDGRLGFTVKSGAADPLSSTNRNGTNGRWYSVPALWVAFEHGGDWTAAARFCHEYFESQLPKVDTSYIDHPPQGAATSTPEIEKLIPVTVTALCEQYPTMRPVVVDGLLREGETANIIAPPKTGKSFLAGNLAWCVADGRTWLSHDCRQGRVLILDNELHPETLANRLTRIADAMQIPIEARNQVEVVSLRGRLTAVNALQFTASIEPGRYRLIVLDALYRMIPQGASENDNAAMMQIYNELDRLAETWKSAVVVVHHTSKGQQGEKSLTDVGAGAGSIARAADAHIAIRPHESEGHHVLEAAVRSFPHPPAVSVQYEYPVWTATTLPPEVRKAGRRDAEKQAKEDADGKSKILAALDENWIMRADLFRKIHVGSAERQNRLLSQLIEADEIESCKRRKKGRTQANVFFRRAQPNQNGSD